MTSTRGPSALGYRYFWDAALSQYAHPAGIVIVSPRGRIAQYFKGIEYPAERAATGAADAPLRVAPGPWPSDCGCFASTTMRSPAGIPVPGSACCCAFWRVATVAALAALIFRLARAPREPCLRHAARQPPILRQRGGRAVLGDDRHDRGGRYRGLHARDLVFDSLPPRCGVNRIAEQLGLRRGAQSRARERSGLPCRCVIFLAFYVWAAWLFFRYETPALRARCRSTWSPSNGCGSSNSPTGGARSTSCTYRSAGRVKLVMTSQDVIHSFYRAGLPHQARRGARALRSDCGSPRRAAASITCSARSTAAPITRAWAVAIVVMEPEDYARWLREPAARRISLATRGARQVPYLGCGGCHGAEAPCTRRPLEHCTAHGIPLAADGRVRDGRRALHARSILHPGTKIAAGYTDLMPTYTGQRERRRAARAHRVHQVAQPQDGRACHAPRAPTAMNVIAARRDRAISTPAKPALLAHDPRPQAHRHPLSGLDHVFFFIGGAAATLIRLELLRPRAIWSPPRPTTSSSPLHGIIMVWFFLIPSIPATLGNFLVPLMIGARDLAFPRLNSLSWYLYILGGVVHARADRHRRRRHRLDLLHAVLARMFSNTHVIASRRRHLHRRLLLDPDRPELHRHGPQHARARPDLVPAAAVRLVDLRHQHHPGAGDAGAGDDACSRSPSSALSASASSIRRSAAIRCCSSICSGSTRTRRSTS